MEPANAGNVVVGLSSFWSWPNISISGGRGDTGVWTNSRPEIIDLWRVLTCAKWLLLRNIMIEDIMIYGEGKGIIDWIKYYTLFIILSLLTG